MFTSTKALLLIANGSEESEVVITADVLRRAGIKVTISSTEGNRDPVECSQNTVIVPDISINEISTDDTYDVVIVPGGDIGPKTMAKNLAVGNLLQQHYNKGKLVAAICAGPTVLQAHKMTKRALVFIANGSEEIEAVTTIDVLRRAEIEVDVVSVENNGHDAVKCSRNVRVLPDKSLDEVKNNQYDCVVIPGGNDGSKAMAASAEVGQILTQHYQDGKIVAAICAGPRALLAHQIGADHKHAITCYPSVRKEFTDGQPYKLDTPDHAVCHSTHTVKGAEEKEYHLVTSQGPGTSMVFALKLIELLKGKDEATKVKEGLLV